jgi:hypothetical protein
MGLSYPILGAGIIRLLLVHDPQEAFHGTLPYPIFARVQYTPCLRIAIIHLEVPS